MILIRLVVGLATAVLTLFAAVLYVAAGIALVCFPIWLFFAILREGVN